MAERPGYQSFVEAHRRIVERLEAKKAAGGEKSFERQERPKHNFTAKLMFDVLTDKGKRYFRVQHCEDCDYHVKHGEITYDTDGLDVMPYRKNVPDEGCIKKSVDNATDTTVN